MNIDLYAALQDEVWRFNKQIHFHHVAPTLYRKGKTYQISSAFFEADMIWFHTYELHWLGPYLPQRFIGNNDFIHFCYTGAEWAALLTESNVIRSNYFDIT